MNPLVSIIIPNYNHARFLKQRLESVFGQTYQNFEVILLDDNSTDDSRSLLKQYASHPKTSHVVFNEKNSGSPFAQWEKGLALAKGDYIWIAESDDFCGNNFLEKLFPLFFKEENVALVYCRSNSVDENGTFFDIFYPDNFDNQKWKTTYFNNGNEELKNFMRYTNTVPNASACLFRKQHFDFSKMKNMFFAGDWLFWAKVLSTGNVYFCSEVLNHFRFHDKTTRSNKSISRYKEYLLVLSFIYKAIGKKLSYERKHFWIYYEMQRQSISLLFLFRHVRPFFYAYSYFRYKLLKHQIRTKLLSKR